jgi:hypothetical protein
VSYEILLPLPDGRVVVMNVQSEYISEEAARILITFVKVIHQLKIASPRDFFYTDQYSYWDARVHRNS